MSVIKDISDFLYAENYQDRILVKYPSIILTIVTLYLLLVKWIIPHFMKDRKPFSLKYPMIIYDFTQSFVNAYLTYTIFTLGSTLWKERCMMKTNPNLPIFQKYINVIAWRIYLVKIADLLDTIMFVLRKKDSQVSFLHVFHHILMCVLCCFFLRSLDSTSMGETFYFVAILRIFSCAMGLMVYGCLPAPLSSKLPDCVNRLGYFLAVGLSINTTVHVLVYLYYGLAAFGPHMNKYLWWKKYLTQFQIVQFFIVLSYIAYGWMTGCEEVGRLEISLFVYVFAILILFFNFYGKYKNE